TGVQTCALPILGPVARPAAHPHLALERARRADGVADDAAGAGGVGAELGAGVLAGGVGPVDDGFAAGPVVLGEGALGFSQAPLDGLLLRREGHGELGRSALGLSPHGAPRRLGPRRKPAASPARRAPDLPLGVLPGLLDLVRDQGRFGAGGLGVVAVLRCRLGLLCAHPQRRVGGLALVLGCSFRRGVRGRRSVVGGLLRRFPLRAARFLLPGQDRVEQRVHPGGYGFGRCFRQVPRRVRRLGRGPGGSLRARGTLPKVAPRPIGGWSWAGPLLGRGFRVLLLGRSSRFGAGRGGLGRGTGGLGDLRVFGRGQEGLDAANDRLAQERVEAGEEVADVARASAGTDDGENAARRRLDESRVRGEAIPTVAFAGGGVGAATRPDDALLGG